MPLPPRAALAFLALAPLSLAACAAQSAPPAAPSAEPVPSSFYLEPRSGQLNDVDGEMMKLAKSEDEIDRLFPHAADDKDARRAAPEVQGKADAKAMKKAEEAPAGGDPCATACSALASMRASAEHLCKLAGNEDGRCEDARGRVRGAVARVRSACPTCSAAATDAVPGK